jgi:uncharacterized protein (TIGR02231 family)
MNAKPLALLLALPLALPLARVAPAYASAAVVDAPVDRVVVFSDRAEVSRKAAAACQGQDGLSMTFPLLPARLDPRTLRAEAAGPAEAIGVTAKLVTAEVPLDPEARAIHDELQTIADARAALDDRARSAEERHTAAEAYATYLQAVLREAARGSAAETARWTEALDVLRAERLRVAEVRQEVTRERLALDRRRDLANRRLAALGGEATRQGYEVTVAIDCKRARRPEVRLSYVVPGATWAPEYDLRFSAQGGDGVGPGQARIEIGAVVRQATGEDWQDAQVVLTTARPRLGAEAPQPAPIYVDGREVGKQRMLVQDVEDRRGLPGGGEAPADRPADQAQIDDGGRAFSLTLPGKVHVRSDARPYRFPVDAVEARAMGRRVTVPKLAPYVYRVVQLDNPASYPLLEGPMHVFRDGAYAGRISLDYTAPGAPMELSLGPDETVRVSRHELDEVDRTPGFLQRTRRFERAYRIELVSAATGPVTVEVRENVPVSRMDDVRVALEEKKTTAGYTLDEERGILSWEVSIPAGATAEVDVGFTVRLPDHWELAGG